MSKDIIKSILRENIFDKIKERSAPKTEEAKTPEGGHGDNHEDKFSKDYSEVTRKLDGTMLKASQVMQAAGLGDPDDATARSLFSKKLRKEKNEEGGQYLFSDEDLAKIMKVINNPSSYLNTGKSKRNK